MNLFQFPKMRKFLIDHVGLIKEDILFLHIDLWIL